MWSVAVFAHNESRNIERCLTSLEHDADRITAYVLVNGCLDDTPQVVSAFARDRPWVRPVFIVLGDKSNAWNVFVHDVAPRSGMYCFLDGDCYFGSGSLDSLAQALDRHGEAYAAAGFPATGRSRDKMSKQLEKSSLCGNMYALSREAVDVIRARSIRLPIGCIGDDSLLNYLLVTDLKGGRNDRHYHRVTPAPGARYYFDPISPLAMDDYVKYFKRQVRYSIRYFQCQLLISKLKREGLAAMPREIDELISPAACRALRPRWGLNAVFDRLALQKMLKGVACR